MPDQPNLIPHSFPAGSLNSIEPQLSQRRLFSNQFIENALEAFHQDDSIEITQLSHSLLQAKIDKIASSLSENSTFNSPNGQLGHTNSVLINTSSNQDIELCIPGYMRMKIRSLIKVDICSQETQVNAFIQFSVNYGKLPRLLVDYLKQSLILRFSKKNSILLKQTQESQLTIKVIEDDFLSLITFSIGLPLTFHFQPSYPFDFINIDMSIWLSPFEKINNVLTITIEDLVVRYDDLMVQFADIYTIEEFQQFQHYFKHLKKWNSDIRKLVVKVNLMNFCQPHINAPEFPLKLQNSPKLFNKKTKSKSQNPISISRLLVQKYKEMANLYTEIESVGSSPMQRFRFDKADMSKDLRIYELNEEIGCLLDRFSMSPNKLTYEEQHLLGQYEIVSQELKVKFSCYKYLKLKKKIEIYSKIYGYIKEIRSGFGRNGVGVRQKQIIEKILLKQKLNNEYSSNPEIIVPSDIVIKCPQQMKLAEQSRKGILKEGTNHREKIIKQVARQMERGKEGPKTFQFAHFQLSIYKHPFVPLAIVFFPLWIIATINLIIYFSSRDLSDRIANIATLLISYVAYFPIFRQQIPEYRYLLLAQIFAYLQIVCSFLTLLHSLIDKQNPQTILDIYNVGPVFWVSFGITISTIFAVVMAYVYHKLAIEPRYKTRSTKRTGRVALRHILWNNYECDFVFLKRLNYLLFDECLEFEKFLRVHYPNTKIRTVPIRLERKNSL